MNKHHRAHYDAERAGKLPIWAVYDHPHDYPCAWIARLWYSLPQPEPTEYVLAHDTLEGLRDMLPPTCTMLARHENDDPKIAETWL
jgi:hypothetical protein